MNATDMLIINSFRDLSISVPSIMRDLKELYVQFNTRNAGKPMDARIELDRLIGKYLHCNQVMFRNFANLLIRNHDYIINSFVMAPDKFIAAASQTVPLNRSTEKPTI